MKKYYLVSAIVLSCAGNAQKNECAALKVELTNVKAENTELSKQNLYYRETLHLITPIKSVNIDGLRIDITSIVASRKKKTLTLTAIYTNLDNKVREVAATDKIVIIDPRGNQYPSTYILMGANDRWARDVQPNIPMKMMAEFNYTEDEFPMVRQLTWYLLTNANYYNKITASFENIPVTWND